MSKPSRADTATIFGRLQARNESLDRDLRLTLSRLAPAEVLAGLSDAIGRQDPERLAAARARLEAQLACTTPQVSWEELSRPSLEEVSRGARVTWRRA
jgi:hypothetical protein